MATVDWISPDQAAKILRVSRSTVYRSLRDQETADRWWGSGNWRVKPLSTRGDLQVREARARELATSTQPLPGEPGDGPAAGGTPPAGGTPT